MQKLKLLILALIIGLPISLSAQDVKFGKVSKDELSLQVYDADSSAAAVFLYKGRNTYYDVERDYWVVITEVHERIKILKPEGLQYATRTIDLMVDEERSERVEKVKGITINLVDGKEKSTKLTDDGIFENKLSDDWNQVSITLPQAKVGSVIDLRYQIISPFTSYIKDVIVQEDIPVKLHFSKIQIVEKYLYNRVIQGGFQANEKDYKSQRRVNFDYDRNVGIAQVNENGTVLYEEFTSEYQYKDVPALKPEPYVNNIENYRRAIKYELSTVIYASGKVDDVTKTWEDVVDEVYQNEGFGRQLNRTSFFKDDLEALTAGIEDPLEKMNKIYSFVQDKMNWNGKVTPLSKDGIAKAYKDGVGNSADINLLLIAMLQEAGLDAAPVLVSTRENGIPVFPTLEGFNYVIASVELADGTYLLDATEEYAAPNVLPVRILNWFGRRISKDGSSSKIDLYPKQISRRTNILTASIDQNGDIFGELKSNFTQLEAFEMRSAYSKKSQSTLEDILLNQYDLDEISNVNLEHKSVADKPLNLSFNFLREASADVIGDEIYLSPMLFLGLYDNPFQLEGRSFPVDFGYPYAHRSIVNIEIPEGYAVSSLPQSINISLPNGIGTFSYKVGSADGKLNVMCNFPLAHLATKWAVQMGS